MEIGGVQWKVEKKEILGFVHKEETARLPHWLLMASTVLVSPEHAAKWASSRPFTCCNARMIMRPGFPNQAWRTLLTHSKAALAFYALTLQLPWRESWVCFNESQPHYKISGTAKVAAT